MFNGEFASSDVENVEEEKRNHEGEGHAADTSVDSLLLFRLGIQVPEEGVDSMLDALEEEESRLRRAPLPCCLPWPPILACYEWRARRRKI